MAKRRPLATIEPHAQFREDVKRGTWEIYLPFPPVPAARPRVSKYGTYYPKTYKQWMFEAAAALATIEEPRLKITDMPVFAGVHAVAKRPQKIINQLPHPDVDNYAKAALDAIQKWGRIYKDDKQVQVLLTSKRYAEEDEEPHLYVKIGLTPEDIGGAEDSFGPHNVGEDVYDLSPDHRVSLEELE